SSLCTAVAVTGRAPYRAVLTHGFVVDEQGYKMSKSLGNVIEPQEILRDLGADILRLWVCSADYRNDLAASANILRQLADAYRKIRNTFRFLLGNLYDFDPRRDAVPYEALPELDRWALLRLGRLIARVLQAYRDYEFHVVYHAVHHFCTVDLSALYLDVIKDRLYTYPPASRARRAAQTVLYEVLSAVVRLLAPVLAFTTEEVWQHMPGGPPAKSVQLADMPAENPRWLDEALGEKWERLLTARSVVNRALEEARRKKLIGNSLEAAVTLYADAGWLGLLEEARGELAPFFIVSALDLRELPADLPDDAVQV
ncbi:MAG: class I tRNA ligase family protein, partial [Firmicutes bacterium]|nr:class I tRNA ligase family protein [Bacillota bacterium]